MHGYFISPENKHKTTQSQTGLNYAIFDKRGPCLIFRDNYKEEETNNKIW